MVRPQVGHQSVYKPVRVAVLDGRAGPIGLVIGDPPQYGVAQSPGPLRCLGNRGIHRGVGRHAGPVELVGTEPEDSTDCGFHVAL